jgi:predicted dehydrogenase
MFAAAAAVVAGSSRTLFAADQGSKSPNEKLSVACIGVRGRGASHFNFFAGRNDTEVTYICDVDSDVGARQAEAVAKKQSRKPKVVVDMREIFDDKSVDIVTTATPNHWHALTSIWAIQAGKDVYVEKPVSHNVSEGRRIVEAARKYNKICQTGTQCRSMPGSMEAIEYIKAGKIGEVKLARGLCYKPRGSIGPRGEYEVPANINYDLWCGPAPMRPLTRKQLHYDWHWIWDYGNGDLGNQGIHQMDVARWGLGVNDIGTGVQSYGGRFGYEDAGETANTQITIHSYPGKTLVFEVRGLKTPDLRGAKVGNIFYGSQGYVVLTSYKGGAAFDLEGKMVEKFDGGDDNMHFANFLKAVRSRSISDLHADILEGHLSSALCHLGNISYRLGSRMTRDEVKQELGNNAEAQETLDRFCQHLEENKVEIGHDKIQLGPRLAIDPKTETFVKNEKADQMLTREYRAPFVVPAAGKV